MKREFVNGIWRSDDEYWTKHHQRCVSDASKVVTCKFCHQDGEAAGFYTWEDIAGLVEWDKFIKEFPEFDDKTLPMCASCCDAAISEWVQIPVASDLCLRTLQFIGELPKRDSSFPMWHSRTDEYRRLRERAIILLGGKCVECGITDRRILQIDHKHGDGVRDRKEHARGRNGYVEYLRHVLGNLQNYQILCANHNWLKRVEKKEYLPMAERA